MSVTVGVDGLEAAVHYFNVMPNVAARSMRLAINTVISRRGMRMAQDAIYDQVDFPKDYLKGDRLYVRKYARENDLEGIIVGRKRATSLARFTQGQAIGRRGGVRVQVKRGQSTYMRRAWLVRLRRGASLTEDNYNVGLALRVNPGESVMGKRGSHKSWLVPNSVALLYGPSVDQVFRTVADDIAEPVADLVADEFFRQFSRLS